MATLREAFELTATLPDSPPTIGVPVKHRRAVNPVKDVDRAKDSDFPPLFGIADDVTVIGPLPRPPVTPATLREAFIFDQAGLGPDWFENVHILPRLGYQFGNILSDQTRQIEMYSSFRNATVTWTAFVNNAGAGVSITNLPGLPEVLRPQREILPPDGLDLLVELEGQSQFNDTLDFTFAGLYTVEFPVSGQRVVLFPFVPELPYRETLGFLTDIMRHKDGTEQRVALRKNPRQTFEQQYFLENIDERQRFETLIFDWQWRIFGVPVWHEDTVLTTVIVPTDTQAQVEETDYRDFRVGGLCVIYDDDKTFEVLEIASVSAGLLTFTGAAALDHPVGTLVMPMRTALMRGVVPAGRLKVNASRPQVTFRITDNDSNLADTAAFNTFNSKVLFDDHNKMIGTEMTESFEREIVILDNTTGAIEQFSDWLAGKRNHQKGFITFGKQELWELRQVLHALAGRQVSFYIPSFNADMVAFTDFLSASTLMPINNIGYTKFIQDRQPKNVVRVVKTNGATFIATITASTEIDATREDLTVTPAWPANILAADIERIEYLEKGRFDKDNQIIEHLSGGLNSRCIIPVKSVLE